ncbi:hypothetical protein SprV_0200781900 [Sparganum proliferum]
MLPHNFTHRMGPFGHMRIHKNLRKTTSGYTTPPHLLPPTPVSQNIITHHQHPIATSQQNLRPRLRLPLLEATFAIILSVYVLSLRTISDQAKIKFYEELHAVLPTVSKTDKLVVLGDFNVCDGTDYAAWRGMLSLHGIDGGKDSSLLLQ